MQFYKLAIGAQLEHRGKRYLKTRMHAVRDEHGQPDCFRSGWEVTPIEESLLLSEEAEKWKPIDLKLWAITWCTLQSKGAIGE